MKKKLSEKDKKELELFGANAWYVESLIETMRENPDSLPENWKTFFKLAISGSNDLNLSPVSEKSLKYPQPKNNDMPTPISGGFARIVENMESSLSLPIAQSQRIVPMKLLEENKILINKHLARTSDIKVSFTHIIAYAVVQALKKHINMNSFFTYVENKPMLVKRNYINLGLAIDIQKKDGSRSLIVPNIKNSELLTFSEFIKKYDDLVRRGRSGQIDVTEFLDTTVSLTNPGTIGTVSSIPRLMLGQGSIISTGAIQYPPEFTGMSFKTISDLGISKTVSVTSTYDHRIIQGAESGNFLKKINELLLGDDNFYENILSDLKIPSIPVKWQKDFKSSNLQNFQDSSILDKQAKVLQLINMYRVRGHLIADLDPLGANSVFHPELDPSFYNLTLWDYDREFITGNFSGIEKATLREILDMLQKTYCNKIGVEYMHIQNPEEKLWLQQKMEPIGNSVQYNVGIKLNILTKLIEAEGFEHYIHTNFLGHKRFSLEGSETLISILDYLFNVGAHTETDEFVLGMAHRGRLNVLVNLMGKSYESIFSEFEDNYDPDSRQGSGDVKYHLGATGSFKANNGRLIKVSLAPNPSHLEWVNPVVEGIVRAKQTRKNDTDKSKTIPVLIHGDSAFAGQGVVAETLNLSQLKGYRTGGTIHIIVNNQIGFTTRPEDSRSSTYATDVAKMIQAPIIHVNGDDPEAALWATELTIMYRQRFNKDVVIDLFGYRRHGHNEGDEPGFTQPLLYSKIKNHPSVLELYSNKLIKEKILSEPEILQLRKKYDAKLTKALERVKAKRQEFKPDTPLAVRKNQIVCIHNDEYGVIDNNILNDIVSRSTSVPEKFALNPKLEKFLEKRREFLNENSFADWAFAEYLAFATLLKENIHVRLSGQDSVRGTFSQRHLGLTDINSGEIYVPLNHMYPKQAQIEALDSSLSEAAVLGFEYGYSTADPLTLVIWEAQFGDFVNGAQVIIDNFIVSSKEKWDVSSNLVLLLPHGFEGQGPEHSSARLERFLILCAQENIEVCYPTLPSQYFHLLRRQVSKSTLRPLVIMTPKSMLRLPEAKSHKSEFINSKFREIIDDHHISNSKDINRIILTSGKVSYDLFAFRKINNISDTAILRIEQFYPINVDYLKEIISKYSNAKEIVWVQEEPQNMGAWNFIKDFISQSKKNNQTVKYAGRSASASPAVGSYKKSVHQQEMLITDAFAKK
ncbi:MAG TPA: multifunctional oxoglutarate decarboxylase/oxoglutarate dehydrogenase thiamine pyrophosphate-binding subunit/dihydrolipoyllysine-residue succinyltransferase subunit [Ignavibacteriaceae bacterium]|nr:multifunctional oxoglutarate decarboxylase/oxoglutarate dehydrogenase thiamine pyrophosphate-binding subunit/dihydrolipoyllysine-residue succinyltransferase subunit [Ignavibacteriaceae bacterium]